MSTVTMGARAAEFILWEPGPTYSRDNATLKSGENLEAGTVLQDDGTGKLVAFTAALNSSLALATESAGILIADTDASAGDTPCAILARTAEVKADFLTYPEETTGGGEEANTFASLAKLGIIVRE